MPGPAQCQRVDDLKKSSFCPFAGAEGRPSHIGDNRVVGTKVRNWTRAESGPRSDFSFTATAWLIRTSGVKVDGLRF
jgi:hypothetical protein